jgi:hypothetical protein
MPPCSIRGAQILLGLWAAPLTAADPPKADKQPAELDGRAEDFFWTRNWNTYYWREDFSFLLRTDDGESWRVVSRRRRRRTTGGWGRPTPT